MAAVLYRLAASRCRPHLYAGQQPQLLLMAADGARDRGAMPRGGEDVSRVQPERQGEERQSGAGRADKQHHHAHRLHVLRFLCLPAEGGQPDDRPCLARRVRHHRASGPDALCWQESHRRELADSGKPKREARRPRPLRQHAGVSHHGHCRGPRPHRFPP